MGLKICSLSSGSTGNCIFVSSETTKLLIDIGIPTSRVEKSLKVLKNTCSDMSVLVTHSHSDHISQIPSFVSKYEAKVYSHYLSSPYLKGKAKYPTNHFKEIGYNDFIIGDMLISPFKVSHDVPCVGYQIYNNNKKISVTTDLGFIDDNTLKSISDSDVVLIECNHDEELVMSNVNYPPYLKRRILSKSGHLSNAACADAVVALAKAGVKQVILAHLSKENNYPELAFNTVSRKLLENGIVEGKDINVEVAAAKSMSGLYEIC